MDAPPPALRRQVGRLLHLREERPGCSEWDVELGGRVERAVAYPELCGPLTPGSEVLLNTTAAALALGTGDAHLIIAVLAAEPETPFPGREAGHIMRLGNPPQPHRVRGVVAGWEAEGRPFSGLGGTPVLAAELHSQAAAAALAARSARMGVRIAWVQLDTAALPLAYSRLLARLRAEGVVAATVAVGQGFGGDLEAVNVYTGLMAARDAGAELIVVTQGPGNVGTGTRYGFGGMALVEALHAASLLGGLAILAPRMSDADPRERHRGVSHHTRTLLRSLRVMVRVPFPAGRADMMPGDTGAGPEVSHNLVPVGPPPGEDVLAGYEESLSTMGRSFTQDSLFFEAAMAAGRYAAEQVTARSGNDAGAGSGTAHLGGLGRPGRGADAV